MKKIYSVAKIAYDSIKASPYENFLGFFALLFPIGCTTAALYLSPFAAGAFKFELTANFEFIFMLLIFILSSALVFIISRKIRIPAKKQNARP